MSEREDKFAQVGEREAAEEHLHIFGVSFAIGAHSISKEVVVFSPLWFPQGKSLMSIVSCD